MDERRSLPAVHRVLEQGRLQPFPREIAKEAVRAALDRARASGEAESAESVAAAAADELESWLFGRHRRVVNATGVVLHTNLGRAPWAPEAVQAAVVAAGYGNVELDLDSGRRGGRMEGVSRLISALTGAEDAFVVNNGAAGVLLVLTALGAGREVVVSRGELVEIGGSFRVPEVIAAGGARLVEVGTTNRTHARDYRAAIGPQTAILLKVHRSNFRTEGFVAEVDVGEMASVAEERGLVVVVDAGSGALTPFGDEPVIRDLVAAGAGLVIFSGDKLLGGPQCGLVVGKRSLVEAVSKHPLYRALRVDKVTLAALEATLSLHARGREVPVQSMLSAEPGALRAAAEAIAGAVRAIGWSASVMPGFSVAGGGSWPGEGLPTSLVVVACRHPERVARALRRGDPAVVARIQESGLVLDPRTLSEAERRDVSGWVDAAMTAAGEARSTPSVP